MVFASSLSRRATLVAACLLATAAHTTYPVSPVAAQDVQQESEKNLKIKLAVGRFSNETRYGRSLLRDQDLDPLGKQASDILTSMLTETNRFLVFERPDIQKIEREQERSEGSVIGVDTLILGSIVEFGRSTDGKRGLFNRKKTQSARATVTIRLVDVKTGLVFHSATGSGESSTTTKTVLGVGSTAEYDATLNDQAISAAISAVINELTTKLDGRSWKSDILQVAGDQVFISGGERQGLKVGDILSVVKAGQVIKSAQTGFDITLPATPVAKIQVTQLFGDSEMNEGAVTKIISGEIKDGRPEGLYVTEDK
ncbi:MULTISPECIES: CsgG/HfaB family protein [Kordiimonas]|jgi:curli biogenesis system outer membrane secretion channel CsgG|uniref:CsgG/HfaB family protein n=1 Tax=Kordiimonas TaxID=288021 RepID=UPI0025807CA2|nr:CsgG/HfaB family protein [Kordiimonas sp. UBA4487]